MVAQEREKKKILESPIGDSCHTLFKKMGGG